MQVIREVPVSVSEYANLNYQKTIKRPRACPRCGVERSIESLGYYSRNVTNPQRGVLRILVRRFRCRNCHSTVSVLPSFAQPYRLVLSQTIGEFFGGALGSRSLSWLPLLKQYWRRFTKWLPQIELTVKLIVERSPPQPDAAGWWELMATMLGDLDKITLLLVSRFGVTLFGRYRCHSPSAS